MIQVMMRGRSTVIGAVARLVIMAGLGTNVLCEAASVYYVATNGNDGWSGTIAAASGNDGPFKTISKARSAVRGQIAAGMTSDITVLIRAGEYPETSMYFNSADAATGGYKVSYKNFPGERPLVHRGRRLTGWQPDVGGIYKVPVDWTFNTLHENGERAYSARHPNTTSSNPYIYSRTNAVISGAETTKFGFGAGDIPIVNNPLALELVIWPAGPEGIWNWVEQIFTLSFIDYSSRVVTLLRGICCGQPTSTPWAIGVGSRYFVQGAKELLDQPGEFWIGNGYLYYWPRQTPIEDQVIIAPGPGGQAVFNFDAGRAQAFNMQIEGLAVGYTDRDYSAFWLSDASQVTIKGNHIFNTGGGGIAVAGLASNNTFDGNLVHDTGGDGINLYGDSTIGYPSQTTISNNYVHHTGQLRRASNGITIGRGSNIKVSHNLIHDTPRMGLRAYGSADASPPVFNAANNTFEFNDVSKGVTDSQDSGLLHFSGVGPGTVVNNNRFHDSDLPFSYGEGIYFDVCNTQTTISNNLVDGLQKVVPGGITYDGIEIKGSNTSISNNIIAQSRLSRGEIDVNKVDSNCPDVPTRDVRVSRNIFASNVTNSIYSFPQFEETQVGSADYNLFFHDSGVYNIGFGYGNGTSSFSASTLTLDQWRTRDARSFDKNSIVADPRFVDPQSRDFRLRPDSAAYHLGFQDIDFASIGLTIDFPFANTSESLARLFATTSQSGSSATVRLGPAETAQLMVSGRTRTGYLVTPATSTLAFSSDLPAVAAVDANGKVTAGVAGLATIGITATQGGAQTSTVMYVDVAGPLSTRQSDCLFNWAEDQYPTLFLPPRLSSTTVAPYYFRFYASTAAYLATSSNDRHLYYFGPLSGNTIMDLGSAFTWYGTSGCH